MKPESNLSSRVRKILQADKNCQHMYLITDAYRSGKKPYDFYMLWGQHFIAIELKYVPKTRKSIDVNKLLVHQLNYLLEVDKGIGVGLYAIYFAKTEELFLCEPDLIKRLRKDFAKSIPIDEFKHYAKLRCEICSVADIASGINKITYER